MNTQLNTHNNHSQANNPMAGHKSKSYVAIYDFMIERYPEHEEHYRKHLLKD